MGLGMTRYACLDMYELYPNPKMNNKFTSGQHNTSEQDEDLCPRRDLSLGCVRAGDIVVHIVGASDDSLSTAQVRKMENETTAEEETPFIRIP